MEKETYEEAREITVEINNLNKVNDLLNNKYIVGIVYRPYDISGNKEDRKIMFNDIPRNADISVQVKSLLLGVIMKRIIYLKDKFSKL